MAGLPCNATYDDATHDDATHHGRALYFEAVMTATFLQIAKVPFVKCPLLSFLLLFAESRHP
jgi:hypothetical protein